MPDLPLLTPHPNPKTIVTKPALATGPQWTTRDAHNGNRWWISYNTSQLGGAPAFILHGDTPSGYEPVGSGNATDDALFAAAAISPAAAAKVPAGKGAKAEVQNVTWQPVIGQSAHTPFPSYDAAQAMLSTVQKNNPAPGDNNPVTAVTDGVTALANAVKGFFAGIISKQLWVRVGEVVVGIVLIAIGLKSLIPSTAVGTAASNALNKIPQVQKVKKVIS